MDWAGRYCLCHRDYKYENILVEDGSVKSVIDWDTLMCADPVFGFVRAETHLVRDVEGLDSEVEEELCGVLWDGYVSGSGFSKSYDEVLDMIMASRLFRVVETMANFDLWFDSSEKDVYKESLRDDVSELHDWFLG